MTSDISSLPQELQILIAINVTFIALLLVMHIKRTAQTRSYANIATKKLGNQQKYLESIVNSVLEGIITINKNGIIQTFNPAAEAMFGYKGDEVIGRNVKILMTDKHKKDHDQYIGNYLKTGEAKIIGIGRDVEAQRKNGKTFPMGLGITHTVINGEDIFVGIIRDITKEKESQKKIRKIQSGFTRSMDRRK